MSGSKNCKISTQVIFFQGGFKIFKKKLSDTVTNHTNANTILLAAQKY